jgi:DNA-binding transcriptional LysR family regulator
MSLGEISTETQELLVFHAVVKHMSAAKAARELGLTPSGVSRVLSRLEERLGVRLLQRTTRKVSLTEEGAVFHSRTMQILNDLADAEAEMRKHAVQPRGNLRMTAPVVFGRLHLSPLLSKLLERHPELGVDLQLVDRFVDLIDEGLDLAIRVGSLPDSRLIARRLCANRRVLVASPAYVARRGVPQTPDELSDHDCLLFTGFSRPREWRLVGPEGPLSVTVSGRVATNNVDALCDAALGGQGVTMGATLQAWPYLRSGELVRVLPEYEFAPSAIFAVFPSARQLSTKVRAMVDFLGDEWTDPPRWDLELNGKVAGF